MTKEWDPNEGNDPGLPPQWQTTETHHLPPEKFLHIVPRSLAVVSSGGGVVVALFTADWRYGLAGLVIAVCCLLHGPWRPRP